MIRVTAQVAVEAIVNAPDGYDRDTMRHVLSDAIDAGVAEFYVGQLRELLRDRLDVAAEGDLCPVCGVHGMQPCVDADGRDVPDHSGRGVSYVNRGGQ